MKAKKLKKKLSLNKETIATLSGDHQEKVVGGGPTFITQRVTCCDTDEGITICQTYTCTVNFSECCPATKQISICICPG